jgi:hypothetical protein
MQLKEVCSLLVKLERENDVNAIELHGIKMWPLIRQCLWFELARVPGSNKNLRAGREHGIRRVLAILRLPRRIRALAEHRNEGHFPITESTTLFLSRPPYLQKLPGSELMFDRIVDPLLFLSLNGEKVSKYYMSALAEDVSLLFPAGVLRPIRTHRGLIETQKIRIQLEDISRQAGLKTEVLNSLFDQALENFYAWYEAGKKLFCSASSLSRIFLTSWYFPDTMGIVAAARERGIRTIDVQHGKQGRFQGMYSWWTRIPPAEGYQLIPDGFWCWGQPSCEHILDSSPDRLIHRPFVGGFPWLDYYRNYISVQSGDRDEVSVHSESAQRVLVTLQKSIGALVEPLPDFLLELLSSERLNSVHFTLRCHPTHRGCMDYCKSRLKNIPAHKYAIHDGSTNLYDDLLQSTHHITAYSSCCYEADSFGVPTLLFGQDAQEIYEEEIRSGMFAWTEGKAIDVERWLKESPVKSDRTEVRQNPYIVSSLSFARKVIFGSR